MGFTEVDWEMAAGAPCMRCGNPSLRFMDGVCSPCFKNKREKIARAEKVRERFLRFRKRHNARIRGSGKTKTA